MKKLLIVLALIVCHSGVTFAGGSAVTVSNVSTMIMPARGLKFTTSVTNGQAVTQGFYRYEIPSRRYWAVTPGTTTNAPTNFSGDFGYDDVTWRYLPAGNRHGFTLVNGTTNEVYWNVGAAAEMNKGSALSTKWSSTLLDANVPQSAVYAISGDPNATLYIMEW